MRCPDCDRRRPARANKRLDPGYGSPLRAWRFEESVTMLRFISAGGGLALIVVGTPAAAITAPGEMENCKFGADHQKLNRAHGKPFLAQGLARTHRPAS